MKAQHVYQKRLKLHITHKAVNEIIGANGNQKNIKNSLMQTVGEALRTQKVEGNPRKGKNQVP
jgi:hypothetical protein